jgi:uncharacterized metal-binding protein YceD (DUF177 family)
MIEELGSGDGDAEAATNPFAALASLKTKK